MSLKASVFIATSLDGYIAAKDGSIDWLNAANAKVPSGEDCGYSAFIKSIDYLIIGRKTFEQVLAFGEWPYSGKPVIVLSSRKIEIPAHLPKTVSWSSESETELYNRLSSAGAKRLYIDGGITIQRFLAAGLISDLTITLIPLFLGDGISLFGTMKNEITLNLIKMHSYDFGFVQLTYMVPRHKI